MGIGNRIEVGRYEVSPTVEATTHVHASDSKAFARGFLQPMDQLSPSPINPEAGLLDDVADFIRDDKARFKRVEGMSELMATDDYVLGVVIGCFARRRLVREGESQ